MQQCGPVMRWMMGAGGFVGMMLLGLGACTQAASPADDDDGGGSATGGIHCEVLTPEACSCFSRENADGPPAECPPAAIPDAFCCADAGWRWRSCARAF